MKRFVLLIISSCVMLFAYAQEEIVLDSIPKTKNGEEGKGASMFMQYKISNNFKVETRVSISNHQSPWEP